MKEQKKKVLLVAHSQIALDQLLLQLSPEINYVKVVSNKDLVNCPEKLRSRCSTASRFESLS